MQNTAGPALVCEDGNVSRGWRVCCYMSCTSILTWGSGSCRLDTPAAPTGDPSHAWSGYRMSTACQLFTLHLVSIINKHSSKQQVVHTRQKVFEALAWRHSRIHKPEHEALLCRQDVSATSPSFAGDTLDLCWWYAPIPTAEGATVSTHWVQSAGRRLLLLGIQSSPKQTGATWIQARIPFTTESSVLACVDVSLVLSKILPLRQSPFLSMQRTP